MTEDMLPLQLIQTCTSTTTPPSRPTVCLLILPPSPLSPYTHRLSIHTYYMAGKLPVNYAGIYQTDLITEKATNMLSSAIANVESTPFFIGIAPTTPHMQVYSNYSFTEPIPKPEYAGLFNDTIVPRWDSYNAQGGVSWVKELPELNQTVLDYVSASL